MIDYLKERLKHQLPYHDIKNERLNVELEDMIVAAEEAAKKSFLKRPPRICSVLIILYQENGAWFTPMIVRPAHSRAHPSQVAFPGGKQEEGDIDLIATAIRETQEEIGVTIPRHQILGELTQMYIPPSNALVTPIVAYADARPSYTPEPAEVDMVLDIPWTELRKPENKGVKKVIMANGAYINLPSFTIQEKVIWGGSARMIAEIIELLKEREVTQAI